MPQTLDEVVLPDRLHHPWRASLFKIFRGSESGQTDDGLVREHECVPPPDIAALLIRTRDNLAVPEKQQRRRELARQGQRSFPAGWR